jgi:hypothetical protein
MTSKGEELEIAFSPGLASRDPDRYLADIDLFD